MSGRRFKSVSPIIAAALTLVIFAVLLRRVPFPRLVDALREADYRWFLALMIPNTLFYFVWDTLVLSVVIRWFHAPVPYRQLLPVRAASYVVGYFNTNLGRGAMAAYLSRRLHAPLLELGSTVIFLVLTEYTQLVLWAMLGIVGFRAEVTSGLLAVAVPNGASIQARLFGDRWLHLDPPLHLVHLTERSLTVGLADAGFLVERVSALRGGQIAIGWLDGLVATLPWDLDLYQALRRPEARSRPLTPGRRAGALAAGALLVPLALAGAATEVALRRPGTVYVEARLA